MTWVGIAVAASAGASLRHVVDFAIASRAPTLPWSTFVVNVTGSFLVGAVAGLAAGGALGSEGAAVVAVGFCGAYTTFSTLVWETLQLARSSTTSRAVANALGSVVAGVLATAAGLALALV